MKDNTFLPILSWNFILILNLSSYHPTNIVILFQLKELLYLTWWSLECQYNFEYTLQFLIIFVIIFPSQTDWQVLCPEPPSSQTKVPVGTVSIVSLSHLLLGTNLFLFSFPHLWSAVPCNHGYNRILLFRL